MSKKPISEEKRKVLKSLWFPLLFVSLLWIIRIYESVFHTDLTYLGLVPLDFKGLRGIIFFPLLHAGWEHLASNSIPVFVLTFALFYFYQPIAWKVFFLIYFIHGFWLWFFGRVAYHIGASGLVYGLGSFLFVSGIIRKNIHLMAISLLVAFLYGSLVWGILPYDVHISWEGHLSGMTAGIVLSFYYKNYGPPSNLGRWKYEDQEILDDFEDDEEDDDNGNAYWKLPPGDENSDQKISEP